MSSFPTGDSWLFIRPLRPSAGLDLLVISRLCTKYGIRTLLQVLVQCSRAAFPQVILMPNGCMCCRVRGDLVDALKRLIVGYSSSRTPEQAGVAPNGTGETAADHADRAAAEASTAGFLGGKGAVADYADAQVPAAKAEQERRGRLDGIILECSGLDELAPVLQVRVWSSDGRSHVLGAGCSQEQHGTKHDIVCVTLRTGVGRRFKYTAVLYLTIVRWRNDVVLRMADVLCGPFCPSARPPRRSGVCLRLAPIVAHAGRAADQYVVGDYRCGGLDTG